MSIDKRVAVDILTEIVKEEPWYYYEPWGTLLCFFCGKEKPDHREDCSWERAETFLKEWGLKIKEVIRVGVQNKPDELRPCRWRIPFLGEEEWQYGFFHGLFPGDEEARIYVALETDDGRTIAGNFLITELQFTDRKKEDGES